MIALLSLLLFGLRGGALHVEQNAHGCISVELETKAEDTFEFVADLFYPNRKYRTSYFNESSVAQHPHSRRKKSKKHSKQLTLNNKHYKGGLTIKTESVCIAIKSPEGIWVVIKTAISGETDGTEAGSTLSITGTVTVGWGVLFTELETTVSGPCSAAQAEAPLATVWNFFKKFGSDRLKQYKKSLGVDEESEKDKFYSMYSKVQTRYSKNFRNKVRAEAQNDLIKFWKLFQEQYQEKVAANPTPQAFKAAREGGLVEIKKYLAVEVFREAFKGAFPVLTSTFQQSFFAVFGEEVGRTDGFQHFVKRFIQGGYFSPMFTNFDNMDPVYQVGVFESLFPDLFGLITECEFGSEDKCYSERLEELQKASIDLKGGVKKCEEDGVSMDFCGADWRLGHVALMLRNHDLKELLKKVEEEFNVDVRFNPPLKWDGFGVGVKFGVRTDAIATGKDALASLCGTNTLALYVDAGVKFSFKWDERAKDYLRQKGNINQVRGLVHFELPNKIGSLEIALSIEMNPAWGSVGYKVPVVLNAMFPYTVPKVNGVDVPLPDAGSLATFLRENAEIISEVKAGTISLADGLSTQLQQFWSKTKASMGKSALQMVGKKTFESLKKDVFAKIQQLTFEGLELPFGAFSKAFKDAADLKKFFKGLATPIKDFLPPIPNFKKDLGKVEEATAYGLEAQINIFYKMSNQDDGARLVELKIFLLNESSKDRSLNLSTPGMKVGIAGKRLSQTGGLLMTYYMCRDTNAASFALDTSDSCGDMKAHFKDLM